MQQQNKKRYIVFDPDDSPEEMVLRINNEMTKTVEQLEAEEAELVNPEADRVKIRLQFLQRKSG